MPKAKSAAQYVADHDTPEAAVDAAIADARSESAAARRFKRAYTPLVETLKLPANVEDSDSAIDAARDSARDALKAAGEGTPDTASANRLKVLTERLGAVFKLDTSTLAALPADATAEQITTAIDALLTPVGERLGRTDTLEREVTVGKAAKFAAVEDADLLEFLGERVPVARKVKVKAEDGTETEEEQYGLGEGDNWKALTEFKPVQALAGTQSKDSGKPPVKNAPTGKIGDKSAPVDPVAALNARMFGSKPAVKE